ncbi:MAG: hypothetical protein RL417_2512 [Pseudomonadota bacterium]|jgi:hypothetical protein
MTARNLALLGLALTGAILLGPYVGIHIITTPPYEEAARRTSGEQPRRRSTAPKAAAPVEEPLGARSRRSAEGERENLADIESLLQSEKR